MSEESTIRWIMHLDMDAFYASVEQLDNPELRGKPVIVGGRERGVVAAASYEARAFGIHSAMPSYQARRLCPEAVFVRGNRARYEEKSSEVFEVLHSYSPLVEPASIDEAYVDLSGLELVFKMSAQELVQEIQKEVVKKTGLSCSVGLAPVKFLAKIASDLKKPRGCSFLTHEMVPEFLKTLDVAKIPGVGKRTLPILHSFGVRTAQDVINYPKDFWERRLGKFGLDLFDRARGIDPRAVEPFTERKSESAENTFMKDIINLDELAKWLLLQSERVGGSLRKQNLSGRTITLKVKYSDFTQVTRSRTLSSATNTTRVIYEVAFALLMHLNPQKPLRLIGVGVSQFDNRAIQLPLPIGDEGLVQLKDKKIDETLDALRNKFGKEAIIRGKIFKEPE